MISLQEIFSWFDKSSLNTREQFPLNRSEDLGICMIDAYHSKKSFCNIDKSCLRAFKRFSHRAVFILSTIGRISYIAFHQIFEHIKIFALFFNLLFILSWSLQLERTLFRAFHIHTLNKWVLSMIVSATHTKLPW